MKPCFNSVFTGFGNTAILGKWLEIVCCGTSRHNAIRFWGITGGAPELNPIIAEIIARLSPLAPKIMLRSNLSALNHGKRDDLTYLLKANNVVIVASFPPLNLAQAEAQRGEGIFKVSVDAIRRLNKLGYGQEYTGLELILVSNPTGAFLPPSQAQMEKHFKQVLEKNRVLNSTIC